MLALVAAMGWGSAMRRELAYILCGGCGVAV